MLIAKAAKARRAGSHSSAGSAMSGMKLFRSPFETRVSAWNV